jgi:hypothetical protein
MPDEYRYRPGNQQHGNELRRLVVVLQQKELDFRADEAE